MLLLKTDQTTLEKEKLKLNSHLKITRKTWMLMFSLQDGPMIKKKTTIN